MALFVVHRDGRLAEGDQILAIDGQVLEAAISHQAAIGILQRARGVVDLVVARGLLNPAAAAVNSVAAASSGSGGGGAGAGGAGPILPPPLFHPSSSIQQLSPVGSSISSARSTRSAGSGQQQQTQPSAALPGTGAAVVTVTRTASPQPPPAVVNVVEPPPVVDILPHPLTTASLGRSPSALSDGSKAGGDMVVCALLSNCLFPSSPHK